MGQNSSPRICKTSFNDVFFAERRKTMAVKIDGHEGKRSVNKSME
jgi:hypothetical protein